MNARRRLFMLAAALLPAPAALSAQRWLYRHYSPPHKDVVHVQVIFKETEEKAMDLCHIGIGCWFPGKDGGPDLIVAPRPKSFNDERALMILGHEFLHALGAEHD